MPYKDKNRYRKYIREYMRKYYRKQQARILELKTKFPDVYQLIFGKTEAKKRRKRRKK